MTMPKKPLPDIPARPMQQCPPGREYVFKTPNGQVVGKARNVREFVDLLKRAPLESVLYHANNGHFSPWLAFMGMQPAAQLAKAVKGNGEDVRKRLIALF